MINQIQKMFVNNSNNENNKKNNCEWGNTLSNNFYD